MTHMVSIAYLSIYVKATINPKGTSLCGKGYQDQEKHEWESSQVQAKEVKVGDPPHTDKSIKTNSIGNASEIETSNLKQSCMYSQTTVSKPHVKHKPKIYN